MPVVSGRDQYGVNVFAIQHLAKVFVDRRCRSELLAGLLGVRLVHVARGDDFHTWHRAHRRGDVVTAKTTADPTHANSLIGAHRLLVGPG